MSNSKDSITLYFFGILAAYAILGLIVLVPGLLTGATTLLLIVIILVVIIVVLFSTAVILKGLSRLLGNFRH